MQRTICGRCCLFHGVRREGAAGHGINEDRGRPSCEDPRGPCRQTGGVMQTVVRAASLHPQMGTSLVSCPLVMGGGDGWVLIWAATMTLHDGVSIWGGRDGQHLWSRPHQLDSHNHRGSCKQGKRTSADTILIKISNDRRVMLIVTTKWDHAGGEAGAKGELKAVPVME
eukprot:1161323-Pelagomonas_calceolata.AAC.4